LRKRKKSREELLIESVTQTYFDFIDFIENPGKHNYIALIYKLKPHTRELIKAKLLDNLIEIERDLRRLRNKMKGIMGYYKDDKPNGMNE